MKHGMHISLWRIATRHSSSTISDTVVTNIVIRSLEFATKYLAYLDNRANFKAYSLTLMLPSLRLMNSFILAYLNSH